MTIVYVLDVIWQTRAYYPLWSLILALCYFVYAVADIAADRDAR